MTSPLHREVSRWAVATVCGGLAGATPVALQLLAVPYQRASVCFEVALWGLALTAPLEAAVGIVRRGGWRWSPLLLLVPPAAIALLLATWVWLEALAAGDLPGAHERAAASLGQLRLRDDEAWALTAIGSVLLPLGCARAACARLKTTCAVSAALPLLLFVWLLAFGEGPHDDPTRASVTVFPLFGPGEALALAVPLLFLAVGLHQGDRLEPVLAGWARSDSPHPPRDASDKQEGESAHIRPAGPHPPLIHNEF